MKAPASNCPPASGVLDMRGVGNNRDWSNGVLEFWIGKRVSQQFGAFLLLLLSLIPSAAIAKKLRISYASVTGNTAVVTYIAQGRKWGQRTFS
jgi:hypothetical protein